jgi:hypothetical protein
VEFYDAAPLSTEAKNNNNRNWRFDTNGAKLDPAAG